MNTHNGTLNNLSYFTNVPQLDTAQKTDEKSEGIVGGLRKRINAEKNIVGQPAFPDYDRKN